jgi:lipoate-protein ligase B
MLPPIFYHYFPQPISYVRALNLQERFHQFQLVQRQTSPQSHNDILLLLQHRPVYTAGRRQSESSIEHERARLTSIGADFVTTARGGQLTYHGPGQLVGYPLLDLSRTSPIMSVREYICRLQKTLEQHLREAHGIEPIVSEHTGVFLNPTTKVGSIGVQVRHRLTTHGFALNITREPLPWFAQVVACGLNDVRAGCIEEAEGKDVKVTVEDEIPGLVDVFGRVFGREMVMMDPAVIMEHDDGGV